MSFSYSNSNSTVENLILAIETAGFPEAVGAVEDLTASVDSLTASMDAASASMGVAGAESGAASAAARRGGLLRGLTSLKGLIAGLGIYEGIKQFSSFTASMERLRTQTGSTQAEVARMSKGIMSMAVSVGFGPNSLAQAMYHIESANFRGKKALDALRIAAKAAQIGGADLTHTVTAMTAVMVAGFRGTHTLAAAMGELNATVGSGDMTMEQLNEALGTGLLSSIKQLGLQVKDAGAALAVLGDNNIRGARAATRLRMGLMQVVRPAKVAQEALANLHMRTFQLADDLRKPNGLLVMIEDLRKHMHGLSKTQQTADLSAIFGGGRNSVVMLTLINQLERLRMKYAAVTAGGNKFNEDWKATTKTFQFFLNQIKAFVDVWLIKLGAGIASVVDWIENKLIPAFQHGKTWAIAIVAGLAAVATATVGVRLAMMAFGAAMLIIENIPLLAVLTAIAFAVIMLIKHWKAVKAAALDAWHWIQNAAHNFWDWVKTHWPLLAEILMGPFTIVLLPIAAIFGTTIPKMLRGFVGWVKSNWHELLSILEWPFVQLWHILQIIWDRILSDVRWVVNHIKSAINTVLGPIKTIGNFFGSVGGGVGDFFGGIVSGAGHILGVDHAGISHTPQAQGGSGPPIIAPRFNAPTLLNGAVSNVGHMPLELHATIINKTDGRETSRTVVRQGLMATARRGVGGAVLADAG